MFGYVRIDKPNITFGHYSEYKAMYCGLCKEIGRVETQMMRFTINYDMTFLALLSHSLDNVTPKIELGRCVTHLIGKKMPIAHSTEILKNIVYINSLLAYYKVYDDVVDDGGTQYKIANSYLNNKYNRAKAKFPNLDAQLSKQYQKLRDLEKSGNGTLDSLGDCFGEMLAAVGEATINNYSQSARMLMYNLGRWIYVIDALDDLKKDAKKLSYNPFLTLYSYSSDTIELIKEEASDYLMLLWRVIKENYEALDIQLFEGPISNIIYLGLKNTTQHVLKGVSIDDK